MRRTPLAAAALLLLAGCSSNDDSTITEPPGSSAATGTEIAITSFTYKPSPLTVAPGATITVTNDDAQDHTVTSEKSGLFKADAIKKGTPVTFTAPTKPGTYRYICDYHSSMKGQIVVKG